MRRSIKFWALSLTVAALWLSSVAAPETARACGGLVCSQSTGGQPVDQSGEDIVYILDSDRSMTMIVRIVYQGDPDQFAWILPVPTAPAAIEIGPESLFTKLTASTSPTFTMIQRTEGTCRDEPVCEDWSSGCSLGCAFGGGDAPVSFSDGGAFAPDASGGVVVVSEGAVGPYQTAVLSSRDATELYTWLEDNGYDLPDSAIPLIADYLAAGDLFVALRLRGGAGTEAIEPVMLRFDALEQACLPIRLTAIATAPVLPIRAYFLGSFPVAPTNYSLLDPPLVPGLFPGAPAGFMAWPNVWANAVEDAGGQAWIRDYSGPTIPVSVALPSLDTITDAAPAVFLRAVLGLYGYPRGAVLTLLRDHVELMDPEASLDTWLTTCQLHGACENTRWDPAGLAAALEATLRPPFAHVQEAFDRLPQLTRLYTTLAVEDMTLDPEFVQDAGLEPQTNAHVATLVTECSSAVFAIGAAQRMEFERGEPVRLREPRPDLDADAACRARGRPGARHDGCTAAFGYDPRTRPFLALALLGAAFLLRRRRLSR